MAQSFLYATCAYTKVHRAYARDPKIYHDPETFNPERFLKDGQLDPDAFDPATIVFGSGRRYAITRSFLASNIALVCD